MCGLVYIFIVRVALSKVELRSTEHCIFIFTTSTTNQQEHTKAAVETIDHKPGRKTNSQPTLNAEITIPQNDTSQIRPAPSLKQNSNFAGMKLLYTSMSVIVLLFTFSIHALPAALPAALPDGGGYITAPCTTSSGCSSGCCTVKTHQCANPILAVSSYDGCIDGIAY